MASPIIAGLDLATTSGLSIIRGDALLHWESHRPNGKADDEIFDGFRQWLLPRLRDDDMQIEFAVLEQPLRPNIDNVTMDTFLRIYGIRAHAVQMLKSRNIPWIDVNIQEWRQAIYGTARAPKQMTTAQRSAWWKQKAVDHCNKFLGWPIKSKDAAEAALIAQWAHTCHLRLSRLNRPGELFADRGAA